MVFMHPWAIAVGAVALVLPVAIHWLTRPKPVRLSLSTIRFVREAVNQRRARHRLLDLLILSLRTLAIAVLAWTISRPLWGEQPLVSPGEVGDINRVVVLDISQSMAAQEHGIQVFERARPLAAGYLANKPGLQANLILAGARPQSTFDRLSSNLSALREKLAELKPRPERLNVQSALNLAAQLLSRGSPDSRTRREVVVISDFQRSNWTGANFSVLPEDTRIQLDSVAPPESLPNLALLRAGIQGPAERNREAQLEVEVGNYSTSLQRVEVSVSIGSQLYHLTGTCSPGNKTTLSTSVALSTPGWHAGEARLEGVKDALSADDVRSFTVFVRPDRSYALLTLQAAETGPSSSYFLERALVPFASRRAQPAEQVVRMNPQHLDREALAAAELLVLEHPGRLSVETSRLLINLVRRGKGLLYVTTEQDDAINLRSLADSAGTDWQLPVLFLPPGREQRRNLVLTEIRRDEMPFRIFGDSLSQFADLRFAEGLPTRRTSNGVPDDILAAFNDGSAALVVTPCGAGTLCVLNLDLAGSHLVRSPAFVPFIGELADRLLGRNLASPSAVPGEPMAFHLPPAVKQAADLEILSPDGQAHSAGELLEQDGGVVWRTTGLPAAGVYRIKNRESTVFAVAAAVPPEESDLRTLDAAVFRERLAGTRRLHYRLAASPENETDTAWSWLAAVCVLCLLTELAVLKAFRT